MKEVKYLELLNDNKLEDLKEKLENEIRKQGAIKTNSKSRFNALERLNKENEKSARPNLKGYGVKNNKYYFTNSYLYAVLNDSCNMEENKSLPVESLYNIDYKQELSRLYISIEDLSYYVKTKKDFTNEYFNGNEKDSYKTIEFDYKFIKYGIDILGTKDTKIFTNQDKTMLILMNSKLERVAILGKKVY